MTYVGLAFLLVAISTFALGRAALTRRKILNLNWSKNTSLRKVKKATGACLANAGWRVILVDSVVDFDVYFGKCRCFLKCNLSSSSVPTILRRDLAEFRRTAAFPIVVLFLQSPGEQLRDQFRADGILAIWYRELYDLASLLANLGVAALPQIESALDPMWIVPKLVTSVASQTEVQPQPPAGGDQAPAPLHMEDRSDYIEGAMEIMNGSDDRHQDQADLHSLLTAGKKAEALKDWESAVNIYRQLQSAAPYQEGAWVGLVRSLTSSKRDDEADVILDDGVSRLPTSLALAIERARAKERRRNWAAAYEVWTEVQRLSPGQIEASLGLALALREIGRFDEADAAIAQAQQRSPADRRLLEAHALVAQVRRDWDQCIERWGLVLRYFPGNLPANVGLLTAYRESRNYDKAQVLLAPCQATFPRSSAIWAESALVLSALGDWDSALSAWNMVHGLDSASPRATIEIAEILFRLKRYSEAKDLLEARKDAFGEHRDIAVCLARIENLAKRWNDAVALWKALERHHPDNVLILSGFAEALWATKDEDTLRSILDRLLLVQPQNTVGAILYARLEMRNGRAADAVRRLTAVSDKSPGNLQISATLNDAQTLAIMDSDLPEFSPVRALESAGYPNENDQPKRLLLQFESLGSGCEFGLLQRKFGAEPIGLLRWAVITADGLSRLLERQFYGIGDPSQTVLTPDGENYVLTDVRYHLAMQTYIPVMSESPATLLPKLCKRQRYLARQLIDNLRRADQILVYKSTERMEAKAAARLQRAVLSYGDNALLIVQLSHEARSPGSLHLNDDGVLLGFVDRFSNTDISVDAWMAVCRASSEVFLHAKAHSRMLMQLKGV